jgi:hypothetical protein
MYWNSINIWAKCWCLRSHHHGAESTGKGSESILPCEPKQSSRRSLQRWVGSATNGSVPQVSISFVQPSDSRDIQNVELCKVWSDVLLFWVLEMWNFWCTGERWRLSTHLFKTFLLVGGSTLYVGYPKLYVYFKCIVVSDLSTGHPCSLYNFYLKFLCYVCMYLSIYTVYPHLHKFHSCKFEYIWAVFAPFIFFAHKHHSNILELNKPQTLHKYMLLSSRVF